jgi:hypothetical protein
MNEQFARGRIDRGEMSKFVEAYHKVLAERLGYQIIRNERVRRTTCGELYVQIAYHAEYALTLLGMVQAGVGDTDAMVKEAVLRLQKAILFIDKSARLRPVTGSCIDLSAVRAFLEQALETARQSTSSVIKIYEAKANVARMRDLVEKAVRMVLTGQFRQPRNLEWCMRHVCEECKDSIIIIGVPSDPECKACVKRKRDEIDRCVRGDPLNEPFPMLIPK